MNNSETLPKGSVFGAICLVAGTCIGGGMLALPVATGIGGFWPSIVMMFAAWFAMTASALLLLEVSLWMEEGVHVITMSSRLLGTPGRMVSWALYLFIAYASLVAYTAGGGKLLSHAFNHYLHLPLSMELSCLLFILLFGVIVDLGSQLVGRVNAVLVIAMLVSYLALIGMGVGEVKTALLNRRDWPYAVWALPLILTTFSFQTMVPSLTPYLKRHATALRSAVIGGTTLTLIVYALWQWLILGIVPVEGPGCLAEALKHGQSPTEFLHTHVQGRWIATLADYFAFFAIVTSFLGIALGLVDFLSDGLKIKKQGWGKLALGAMIIIPTLFFAITYERAFIVAMETTGGIGDSILNGMMPVLMVWIGRYRMGMTGPLRLPGGQPALVAIFLFFLAVLIIQLIAFAWHPALIYNARELVD